VIAILTIFWYIYHAFYSRYMLKNQLNSFAFLGLASFFVCGSFLFAFTVRAADSGTKPDFQINGGADETNSLRVNLQFFRVQGYDQVRVSNSEKFLAGSWQPLEPTLEWILLPGKGKKTVHVQIKGENKEKITGSRSIKYKQLRGDLQSGRVVTAGDGFFYYVGFDEQLHPFPTMAVYHSWYDDFNKITDVDPVILRKYPIGIPVCVRFGTWLVQFSGFPRIYAVEPGCRLRPIRSETEGFLLYGSAWKKRVLILDRTQETFYSKNTSGITMPIKDSDNDGLSDQEESSYWNTNPLAKDSDGDGMADGAEIQAGRSPLGTGNILTDPLFQYRYPVGAVVSEPGSGSSLFIPVLNNKVRNVSSEALKETKSAPGYQSIFFSKAPYKTGLAARANNTLGRSEDRFFFPTIYFQNRLTLH